MVTTGRGTDTYAVVGVFEGADRAEAAVNGLRDAGFDAQHVSVVAKDNREAREVTDRTDMTDEGAASGAVTGGLLGGLTGFLVGISALVIPGIGPIVGTGILVSTLAGAGIGAAAGGLVGALVGQGVPEEDARTYETYVNEGRILISVVAHGEAQAEQARDILDRSGGHEVRHYPAAAK